ncbi:MAG: SUMF1/EgtB/PvdO family nonheme iron enzyme [Deltaproteobacteria bacterium]|nr:SUMF1/EgtB/PvdO family nonheme iron enzyme [Deltaproteobacteria bacterium]
MLYDSRGFGRSRLGGVVLRGGSWNNNTDNLRASNRNRNEPDNRNNNNGFRVAST